MKKQNRIKILKKKSKVQFYKQYSKSFEIKLKLMTQVCY